MTEIPRRNREYSTPVPGRRPRKPQPRKLRLLTTISASLALFLALFALLAYQLRTGHDPVLSKQMASASGQPKIVIHKRIVKRVVKVKYKTVAPRPSASSASASQTSSSQPTPAASYSGGGTSNSSAPSSAPVVAQSTITATPAISAPVSRAS